MVRWSWRLFLLTLLLLQLVTAAKTCLALMSSEQQQPGPGPTLPFKVKTTPKSGDILVKNPTKLHAVIPVLRREDAIEGSMMYDYKPSLVLLNNSELLMAFRHQNSSLSQLHAIFMRSKDGGVSWARETPTNFDAAGHPQAIGGGEFSLHMAPDGSVLVLSGCIAWRSTDLGKTFPHCNLLNWPEFKLPFGHCHSSMAWSVVHIADDDPVVASELEPSCKLLRTTAAGLSMVGLHGGAQRLAGCHQGCTSFVTLLSSARQITV